MNPVYPTVLGAMTAPFLTCWIQPAHILYCWDSHLLYPLLKVYITSYRSVGAIWCEPPSNFPHIGEQKKHTLRSRACVASTGNDERCQYVEGGIIVLGRKKTVIDFSHHKIGLKFDIFYGRSQFVWHERKASFGRFLFLGFFLAIFYSCYFKLASNNYHDSAAILEKMSTNFSTPNFFCK